MAAPRKFPPDGAAEDIERLAADGFSQLGIAAHFKVSRECFLRWIKEDEELNEAYDLGRETERQALHAMIVASARANKPANVNAFFLLKARHGYVETDNRTKVSVDVALNNVLVVRDFGDDATWAAKCAAQQRELTADCTSPLQLEASTAPHVDPVPVAPSWVAPIKQAAPKTAAPYYGPPVLDWQSQPAPAPIYAPEPIRSAPVAPMMAPRWHARA